MDVKDFFPPAGHVQRNYCSSCNEALHLGFAEFNEEVSGVRIAISGLPVLRCPKCNRDHWPDGSRFAIIQIHKNAVEKNAQSVTVQRRKRSDTFDFTEVPFIYDADDYFYIPGLTRPHDVGFLTPVFFNRHVLLKYDTAPGYRVKFASRTYGDIVSDEGDMTSFGINRHGRVVMWLGDIARLPVSEQYYLRSENVESDHAIGSEFYDAQLECVFTEPSSEDRLLRLRSDFLEACFERFGTKIAHLDKEVVALALDFIAPIVDTPKERRHVADTLNKIHVESLDNKAMGALLTRAGGDPKSLGSLKRLEALFKSIAKDPASVPAILLPFFVVYDLRVAHSHLTSEESSEALLGTVATRLGILPSSGLSETSAVLTKKLASSYEALTLIAK